MSTYNYAPGAVHLDFHHNNISMSASTITDLVRSLISDRAEDITPVQEETPAQKEYCVYICREKLQEQGIYTLDEFENMMANASKGIATDFATFLKRYKAQGILNFMGHSKRKIFDYFRAHYPEMRAYEYPNFSAAF